MIATTYYLPAHFLDASGLLVPVMSSSSSFFLAHMTNLAPPFYVSLRPVPYGYVCKQDNILTLVRRTQGGKLEVLIH